MSEDIMCPHCQEALREEELSILHCPCCYREYTLVDGILTELK